MTNPVIDNIRRSLGRTAQTPLSQRPVLQASRQPESINSEIEMFLKEVKKLSGVGRRLSPSEIDTSLKTLIE